MHKTIYAIRSNRTNKYLTSLFTNNHNKTFEAVKFKRPSEGGNCYYYNTKETALAVAEELDGYVEELTLLEQ